MQKMNNTPNKTRLQRRIEKAWMNKQKSVADQHLEKIHETQHVDLKHDLIKERMMRVKLKDDLIKEEFYIVSMAYFCRTIEDVYLPAELGVIKYSLQRGVQEEFHMHINPGKIPIGLRFEAEHHTKNSHELPIPPKALGLTDYDEIARKLLCFLQTSEQFPLLLFTNAKDVPIVESMLVAILGTRMKKGMLYVCSLPDLFDQLQNRVNVYNKDLQTNSTVRVAQQLLDMDWFSYTSGISCEYHESNSLLVHCALSQCIRWAYTISKYCCAHLDIKMIPGKHAPNIIKEQELSTVTDTDNSEDDDSSDGPNYDTLSFVSYATDFTSMSMGQSEAVDEGKELDNTLLYYK